MYKILKELREYNPQTKEDLIYCANKFLQYVKKNDLVSENTLIDVIKTMRSFDIGIATIQDSNIVSNCLVDASLVQKFGHPIVLSINNRITSIPGKRYFYLYEFAHYLFDYDEYNVPCFYHKYILYSSKTLDFFDWRAIFFTLEVLMPSDLFTQKYYTYLKETNSLPRTIQKLADDFCVTPGQVELKLRRYFSWTFHLD